ncbi:hypothetical protein ACIBAF_40005, partial [Streptomyces sp. NPDC051677]
RSSAGRPPPKSSKNNYAHFNNPVLHRPVELAQYRAIRYTERLEQEAAVASVGSKGDSYDCQSLGTGSRKDSVAPAVTV